VEGRAAAIFARRIRDIEVWRGCSPPGLGTLKCGGGSPTRIRELEVWRVCPSTLYKANCGGVGRQDERRD